MCECEIFLNILVVHYFIRMKKSKKYRITVQDYIKAQRRASRLEEIELHGKPVSRRSALHKSKKIYDRKRLKKEDFSGE